MKEIVVATATAFAVMVEDSGFQGNQEEARKGVWAGAGAGVGTSMTLALALTLRGQHQPQPWRCRGVPMAPRAGHGACGGRTQLCTRVCTGGRTWGTEVCRAACALSLAGLACGGSGGCPMPPLLRT